MRCDQQPAFSLTEGRTATRLFPCFYRGPASRVAKRCYGVGAQMQHFFRQYLLYVTFEVLEPLWAAMAAALRAATTLDQVDQP